MAAHLLNCPAGQESQTMVAIWYGTATTDIHVALTDALPEVPEGALVASMADLMARGLFQRVSATQVSASGESQN